MRRRYCLYGKLLTAVRSVRYAPAMSDHVRTPQMMKREVSGEGGALWRTLYHLWPYMWPANRPDLKARVLTALGLLLVAKLATIAVPFTFKWATDALVQDTSGAQLTTF